MYILYYIEIYQIILQNRCITKPLKNAIEQNIYRKGTIFVFHMFIYRKNDLIISIFEGLASPQHLLPNKNVIRAI